MTGRSAPHGPKQVPAPDAGAPGPWSTRASAIRTIAAGLLSGLNVLLRAVAMAALVFAGPLDPYLPTGIALAVISAIILSATVALAGSYRGSIGNVSESNGILALVAISIVAGSGGNAAASATTVIAAIAISTLAIGASLFTLGVLRLGRLVRYIPYPVIGGFQAGVGWLLVQGGLSVSMGQSTRAIELPALFENEALVRWAPALALGALLLVLRRRMSRAVAIPATLVVASVAFWLVAAYLDQSATELAAAGWLLGPYPDDGLWTHLAPVAAFSGVQWNLLLAELPKLGVMVLITLVGVLLTGTSLELVVRRDVDLDRDLRAAGIANLLAGLAGGMHGYHSLSSSMLSHQMHAPHRATGVICAAFCVVCFFAGSAFLDYVPMVVPAVLLFYIGLDLLHAWLHRARTRLGHSDFAVVVAVFTMVVFVGFVEGVAFGVLAAVVLFAVSSSRVNVVRQAFTGAQVQSTALRSDYPRELLQEAGRAIFVLRLNGYIFFGTAYRMVHELRARLGDRRETPLRFLLLDLKLVTGMDASAVISVRKLVQYAQDYGFEVVLTDTPHEVRGLLGRAGIATERRGRVGMCRDGPDRRAPAPAWLDDPDDAQTMHLRAFPDLDHGLEWCETTLVQERDKGGTRRITSLRDWLARGLGNSGRADRFLECATLEKFLPGEQLLQQGGTSTHLLLVRSGLVSVRLRAPGGRMARLRRLGPGAVLGEVAFYLAHERTASVVAEEPTSVYQITRAAMKAMQEREPELCMRFHSLMARTLAERVHDTDITLAALVD